MKFDTEDIHSANVSFMKIGAVKRIIDLPARKRKFDRIFYFFGPISIKFGIWINKLLNECEFREKQVCHSLLRGVNELLSVLPKFIAGFVEISDITHLYIMLHSTCEFLKNRDREGRTFLTGVNGITFTRVP